MKHFSVCDYNKHINKKTQYGTSDINLVYVFKTFLYSYADINPYKQNTLIFLKIFV